LTSPYVHPQANGMECDSNRDMLLQQMQSNYIHHPCTKNTIFHHIRILATFSVLSKSRPEIKTS